MKINLLFLGILAIALLFIGGIIPAEWGEIILIVLGSAAIAIGIIDVFNDKSL